MQRRPTADVTVYVRRFIPREKRNDPLNSVTLDITASMQELEQRVASYLLERFPLVDFSVMTLNEAPPSGCFWIDVRAEDHQLEVQTEVMLTWFDWEHPGWRIMTDSAVVHHYRQRDGVARRIRTWHHPRFGWSGMDIDHRAELVKDCADRFDAYYQVRKRLEGDRDDRRETKSPESGEGRTGRAGREKGSEGANSAGPVAGSERGGDPAGDY